MDDVTAVLLRALAAADDGAGSCDPVRAATIKDAVGGVKPQIVVRPATVAGVSAVMRAASEHGLVVVPRGAGSAIDWAVPPERADIVLELSALDRVVEHQPGDLVVVTQAGASLRHVQQVVGEAGQRLPFELPRERVAEGGTVGGAVATAVVAPRRLRLGAVRDHLLGATIVLADGTVASTGGKVVKNVAGYDLAKMVTGSFGTLAILVQAAWRLLSEPAERAFVMFEDDLRRACELARTATVSQLAPSAVELDRSPGQARARIAVLLEGSASGVRARAEALSSLVGGAVAPEPPWWGRLPAARDDVLIKATATVSGVGMFLSAVARAEAALGVPISVRGSAAGVLLLGLPADVPPAVMRAVLAELRSLRASPGDGSVTVLHASPFLLDAVDPWGPVAGLDIMRRIKQRLDPARALAPGRFVGGI